MINFFVSILPLDILFAWVYVKNNRSIFVCMFFHFFVNFLQEKIAITQTTKYVETIEFYNWDFTYDKEKGFKPSVIIDKEGKQTVSLKTGTHFIAVKVVDNDGLENVELITLKINGAVEQVKSKGENKHEQSKKNQINKTAFG
jgi:hypothetical protein